MCDDLYSMTTTHQAMRQLFRTGSGWSQLRLPGIFPDHRAPIVCRRINGEREVVAARWGMPTPPAFLKGRLTVARPTNTNSPHWRGWMRPEFRCLVSATSFSEPTDAADPVTGKKVWTWFAINDERPLDPFIGAVAVRLYNHSLCTAERSRQEAISDRATMTTTTGVPGSPRGHYD